MTIVLNLLFCLEQIIFSLANLRNKVRLSHQYLYACSIVLGRLSGTSCKHKSSTLVASVPLIKLKGDACVLSDTDVLIT